MFGHATINGQDGNPSVTPAAITPMGTATNAYANSQYSLTTTANAQYDQAAQQQAASANYAACIHPPLPPDYSAGTASCAYGVIGEGKPPGNKTSMATGANAVAIGHHAGYEQAVYEAATNYIQAKNHIPAVGGGWAQKIVGDQKGYPKKRYGLSHQQAGYKDHMEGKTHERKEQLAKEDPQMVIRGRIAFRRDVCDLTCSSKDTFDAHVKGQKHQRTIALLRRMGKSVPEMNFDTQRPGEAQGQQIPTVGSGGPLKKVVGVIGTKFVGGSTLLSIGEELKSGGGAAPNPVASITGAVKPQDLEKAVLGDENVKPVGQEFIEEERDASGKFLTYSCKLCDCKFSDFGAKNVHLKGRRHRLNYKQKVDPSLKVEMKPANWGRHKDMLQPVPLGAYIPGGAPAFQIVQEPRPVYPMQRNQQIMDDRHVIHKLEEIQLKADKVRSVECLAFLAEKMLKTVSDSMINNGGWTGEQVEQNRVLKGVMRVGLLAKHLLINSDNQIELVVLCSKTPTITLLREVVELFKKNAEIPSNEQLAVSNLINESAFALQLSSIRFKRRAILTCGALHMPVSNVGNRASAGGAGAGPAGQIQADPWFDILEKRLRKFDQQMLVQVGHVSFPISDLLSIRQRRTRMFWLNEAIIYTFLRLVQQETKQPFLLVSGNEVHFFAKESWIPAIADENVIICPMRIEARGSPHWILIYANIREQEIILLDSDNKGETSLYKRQLQLQFFDMLTKMTRRVEAGARHLWTINEALHIPQQSTGCGCGPYVLSFAQTLLKGGIRSLLGLVGVDAIAVRKEIAIKIIANSTLSHLLPPPPPSTPTSTSSSSNQKVPPTSASSNQVPTSSSASIQQQQPCNSSSSASIQKQQQPCSSSSSASIQKQQQPCSSSSSASIQQQQPCNSSSSASIQKQQQPCSSSSSASIQKQQQPCSSSSSASIQQQQELHVEIGEGGKRGENDSRRKRKKGITMPKKRHANVTRQRIVATEFLVEDQDGDVHCKVVNRNGEGWLTDDLPLNEATEQIASTTVTTLLQIGWRPSENTNEIGLQHIRRGVDRGIEEWAIEQNRTDEERDQIIRDQLAPNVGDTSVAKTLGSSASTYAEYQKRRKNEAKKNKRLAKKGRAE